MAGKYAKNDVVYLVESNKYVREVQIIRYSGGLYTIQLRKGAGGIKVRESRLFPSRQEAEATITKQETMPERSHQTPWD